MYLMITIIVTSVLLLPMLIWSSREKTRSSQGVAMTTMVLFTIINTFASSVAIMEGIL